MSWQIDLPEVLVVTDLPSALALAEELRHIKIIALDTETNGLDKIRSNIWCWSLAWTGRDGVNKRAFLKESEQAYTDQWFRVFKDIFEDPDKIWVMHNAKFDMHMLANSGVRPAGRIADTLVMHALLYDEEEHGLKYVTKQLLDWTWAGFGKQFEFDSKKEDSGTTLDRAWESDPGRVIEYACADAFGTLQIFHKMEELLEREEVLMWIYPDRQCTLLEVFWETECPYTKVLWKCEREGALTDVDHLRKIRPNIEKSLNEYRSKIVKLTDGVVMKASSNQQWASYLFDIKKYPVYKRTTGGKSGIRSPSVDSATMSRLLDETQDPAIEQKIEYSKLDKLYSTYISEAGMAKFITQANRIHCNLNQAGAKGGRLSSSEPNLQTIPTGKKDTQGLRAAFVAPKGEVIICLDYDQLEMRILADLSGEASMQQIFLDGKDIHSGNAASIYKLDYDDIQFAKDMKDKDLEGLNPTRVEYLLKCKESRKSIKSVGFGLNYGIGVRGLAAQLHCSTTEAQKIMTDYMDHYPGVPSFFAMATEVARDTGYAYTYMGRRRKVSNIHSTNRALRSAAERVSTNVIIQGSGADIVKLAMLKIDAAELDKKYGYRMFLQVHDEILGYCPEETAVDAMAEVKYIMEHSLPVARSVPFTASGGIGNNWKEAK